MDECPHCGEPIDEDAESCAHCGSDFESGWKPDAEYYSDAPDDDPLSKEDSSHNARTSHWEQALHVSLVAGSFLIFLGAAASLHKLYLTHVAAFALLPAASLLWYYRLLAVRSDPDD